MIPKRSMLAPQKDFDENNPNHNEEVLAMCRLFQWLLPGLVTNVVFFRHQLQG